LIKREQLPYVLRTVAATAKPGKLRIPRIDEPIVKHLSSLWKSCTGVAAASRQIESRGGPKQVFGVAFLLASDRVEAFKEALERHSDEARRLGLAYYLEGPRPAFTFT
jgi:hypothetical protein